MYKFKIKKAINGQYYWTFVSSNGQTICTTETYTTKQNAKTAAETVKKEASGASIVDEA